MSIRENRWYKVLPFLENLENKLFSQFCPLTSPIESIRQQICRSHLELLPASSTNSDPAWLTLLCSMVNERRNKRGRTGEL
ncbi:hypothetical protein AAHA92_21619 [Salvia divinorum]|uniref:Maturase K n=1 Tax=Salvia divinorum TaxID=28513 RepID=A0ABD1GL11_SALDI